MRTSRSKRKCERWARLLIKHAYLLRHQAGSKARWFCRVCWMARLQNKILGSFLQAAQQQATVPGTLTQVVLRTSPPTCLRINHRGAANICIADVCNSDKFDGGNNSGTCVCNVRSVRHWVVGPSSPCRRRRSVGHTVRPQLLAASAHAEA